MAKSHNRAAQELRPLKFSPNWLHNAHGSCLLEMGKTRVVAAASFSEGVPSFLRGSGAGWLTAEYGMLPASASSRMGREAAKGKQKGRTVEIQRLIGRSLRQAVDMEALGENTILVDCDVLDADGGTRTACITAGYVAVHLAVHKAMKEGILSASPIVQQIAAVSVGIVDGKPVLDLDYELDSCAEVDMNVVMTDQGRYVEIQGTGEQASYTDAQLKKLLSYAKGGISALFEAQRKSLRKAGVRGLK